MKELNIKYIRKSITALIIFVLLTYILITTKDLLTRIVIIPFIVFSLSFFIEKVLLIFNKKLFAKKVSKVYVIAFLVYWFGFLFCWEYINITNKEYMSVLFSLPCWIGGIYIAYKRLFKKEQEK